MTPELKRLWVDALRSGKYLQGFDMLRTPDNHYCCLGVLADISGVEWRQTTLYNGKVIWEANMGPGGWEDRDLSAKFCDRVGLSLLSSYYLAGLNDSHNNFEKIAGEIETDPFI